MVVIKRVDCNKKFKLFRFLRNVAQFYYRMDSFEVKVEIKC